MTITRNQAIRALTDSTPVYDRKGAAGILIEINENGYRWLRASDGETFTFPGVKKCECLSLAKGGPATP